MTADAVFARLRRRPFVPFRSSRTACGIMHPDALFVSKSGPAVTLYDRGQQPSPDQVPAPEALVSYLHVATTEDLPVPATRAG